MIAASAGVKVMVAANPVDFRKVVTVSPRWCDRSASRLGSRFAVGTTTPLSD